MRIIALGDTHGRSFWKYIVNTQKWDMVVFLADYLDSYHFSGEEQLRNLLDIIEFKKSNPDKVILLIGNHDWHYFPEIDHDKTAEYQPEMKPTFSYTLDQYRNLFQMAYKYDNILFTHAGFAPTWIETLVKFANVRQQFVEYTTDTIQDVINNLWEYKPYSFMFRDYNGRANSYGDDPYQSPIWIRPKSLMKDAVLLKKEIIQVVGHTSQSQIDIKGKSTGGRYYFIDTLGTSGEYLIIEDGTFKTGKV